MPYLLEHLWRLSPFVFFLPFVFGGALLVNTGAGVVRAMTWKHGGGEPRDKTLSFVGTVLVWVGLVLAVLAIGERAVEAGRAPFKTLYESLILLVATTAGIYAVIEAKFRHPLLSIPAAALLLGVVGYAAMKADVEIVDLPAALQSAWFVPHVVVYFLGYGALFVAGVAAFGFLVFPRFELLFWNIKGQPTRHRLDTIMHRLNILGFVLLTLGLLMGAWWAKSAWGDWWVWDPKENWALVSWLVYVVYFHLRLIRGWTPRRMAVVTLIGCLAVVFTYLGMNLLPTAEMSEHVYQ